MSSPTSPPSDSDSPIAYRPSLLRTCCPEEVNQLKSIRNDSSTTKFDTIDEQLCCLVQTRSPQKTLSSDEIRRQVEELLAGTAADDYGVWAYYPWSKRLVHILDEAEFVELRTSRNRYKITPVEQERLSQASVGVVGLSVGQAVALTMAIERSFGEIRLADFDTLELSNLNRLRSGIHDLGIPKVLIAAREIAEIDPYLRVKCYSDGITEHNIDDFFLDGGKLSLLVEECDSLDIKVLCRERARMHRVPVVMDTSDRGMVDVERFDLQPDRPLFHGLTDVPPIHELRELTNEQKVPFILSILETDKLSTRIRASMLEINESISTWPQLATAVALGGAVTGDVCRRILLDQFRDSGRYRVDLDTVFAAESATCTEMPDALLTQSPVVEQILSSISQFSQHFSDATELSHDQVAELVKGGCLAPTAGNLQPWQWIWSHNRLWLATEPGRQMNMDVDGRVAYLGLGAAIENVELLANTMQLTAMLNRELVDLNKQLVAVFEFSRRPDNVRVDPLVDCISARFTDRRIAERQPVEQAKLDALQSAVLPLDAELVIFQKDEELDLVRELIAVGDRMRLLHPAGHKDFTSEIRWTPAAVAETRDGVDPATVELSPVEEASLAMLRDQSAIRLLREQGLGLGLEKLSRKAIDGASAVCCLRMKIDSPNDFLRAGRAMQRSWLEATRQNLAFHPVGGVLFVLAYMQWEIENNVLGFTVEERTQLISSKRRFDRLAGGNDKLEHVFMFRIAPAGQPPEVRSLRRGVEDVLTFG